MALRIPVKSKSTCNLCGDPVDSLVAVQDVAELQNKSHEGRYHNLYRILFVFPFEGSDWILLRRLESERE